MTTSTPRTSLSPPSAPGRWVTVLLVILLCSVSLSPLAAATTHPVDVAQGGVSQTAAVSPQGVVAGAEPTDRHWQVSDPVNNSTNAANDSEPVRHRDPRGLSEEGDLSDLEETLANLLADRLNESSVAVERGQYVRARTLLGDQYSAILSRYVRVASETPRRADNSDRFNVTRDEQSAFVDSVASYREKRTEYDAAKRRGDEGQARSTARELDALAIDAEERTERLSREYATLSTTSGRDFSTTTQVLSRVQQNISAEQAIIREAEFVETSLTVVDVSGGGSFVDPVRISARLVDENGTAISDQAVRIEVNGTEHRVETDGSGVFTALYRPVTDGLGEQTLTLEYVPRSDSEYLGSQTRTSAVIVQTTPTITVDEASSTATFGNPVAVSGAISAGGRPVTGAPLAVTVDDVLIGRVASDDIGEFHFERALPASVVRGDRQLQVAFAFDDRALAPVETVTPLSVETTRTALTVDGRQAALESIVVVGRLTTVDGRPVAAQPISVSVMGEQSALTRTSRTGRFSSSIWLPVMDADQSVVDVVVVFDGTDTNLESARATLRVEIVGSDTTRSSGAAAGSNSDGSSDAETGGEDTEPASEETPAGPLGKILIGLVGASATIEFYGVSLSKLAGSIWFDVGVILFVVTLAGSLFVVLRRRRAASTAVALRDGLTDTVSAPSVDASTDEMVELPVLLLELAHARTDDGNARLGVEYAYLSARTSLATRLELSNRGTHRQFATACLAVLDRADREAFSALTDRYERALFGTRPLSDDDVTDALAEAQALLDTPDAGDDGAGPVTSFGSPPRGGDSLFPRDTGTGSHGD